MARFRTSRALLIALALVLATALAVGTVVIERPRAAHAAALPRVPVMGPRILTAEEMAAWYNSRQHAPYKVPGISVRNLAQQFLEEGFDEGVRGDIAFAQSIVETGWFGYVGSIVKPGNLNFAGMGACDSCSSGTQFKSPRSGVRAQIQDLRNYADIHSRASNMHHPLVPEWYGSPPSIAAHNFDTFFRKGKAPTWNQMGHGNHATSPIYGSTVISVYQSMLVFNGLPAGAAAGMEPLGNLEVIQRIPDGVHIRGWTVDPSSPAPTAVDVYLNGRGFVRRLANVERPDVHAAFSSGSKHGFDMVLPIRGGTICVFAINIGSGVRNPSLGCRTVAGTAPLTRIETLSRGADGLRIKGWAVDPDSAAPMAIDVYANGVGMGRLTAGASRPDVGAAFPGYGAAHGLDALLPGVGGRVCLYAINAGAGSGNRLVGCWNRLGTKPFGRIDAATPGTYGVRVRGWALDPDSAAPAQIDIYANGVGMGRFTAGGARTDVGSAYPGYGSARGFDVVVPVAGGTVCAYGINTGAGSNVLLGCRNA